MPLDKKEIHRGKFLTGAAHAVEDPRRKHIAKHQFMTVDAIVPKRAPLPEDLGAVRCCAWPSIPYWSSRPRGTPLRIRLTSIME